MESREEQEKRLARRRIGVFAGLIVLFLLIVLFVIFYGRSNLGKSIHYVNGAAEIQCEGENYILFNDIESKTFIGSMVSDMLNARRGEKVGSITSYGILTMAVVYRVEGDTSGELLMDSRERIYVKKGTEDKYKEFTADSNFGNPKMTSGAKTFDSLVPVDSERYASVMEALSSYKKENAEEGSTALNLTVTINDPLVSESTEIKREIFVFSPDGVFYKASLEIFRYKDHLYVTTDYKDNGEKEANTLYGLRLSEEDEAYFRSIWK